MQWVKDPVLSLLWLGSLLLLWVQSLAQELPHVLDAPPPQKRSLRTPPWISTQGGITGLLLYAPEYPCHPS